MSCFSLRIRRIERTAEYVGGSGSSAMISATVDSPRRCRISMTCRSRLERSSVGDVLDIGPGKRVLGADFSTVLNFQHEVRFCQGSGFISPCASRTEG